MAGTGTITATTTAATLGTVTPYRSLLVQADPDNTANVKVGNAGAQDFELRPGEALCLPVPQGGVIHAKSVSGSQVVNWFGSYESAPLALYPTTVPNATTHQVTATLAGDSTPAVAAAGDYADNDIVSNSATNGAGVAWVFADMARVEAGKGRILTALITCSVAAVVASFRLHLFTANPSASELDDNAAFSVHANDQDKYLGWIDFPALVAGRSFVDDLNIPYTCAASSTSLYGILQITDAETGEVASMVVVLQLGIERFLS